MHARRAAPLALLLAFAACSKEVSQGAPAADVVLAAFATDATNPAYLAGAPGPKIPQPNDLGLQAAAALPAGAQKELLQIFAATGGFPSDQEVPITIPVRALRFSAGAYAPVAVPDLDLATVNAQTVKVLRLDGAAAEVAFDVGGYVTSSDGLVGTLTLRRQAVSGSRRWAPGRYVVALRGGPAGVKTAAGVPLSAEQPIALIAQNRNLASPENQPPGGLTAAQVTQLEQLRGLLANAVPWCNMTSGPAPGWNPVTSVQAGALCGTPPSPPARSAFAAVASHFPLAELASIQTFEIAPTPGAVALVDAGSGSAPLPIDLLRTGPGGTIALNAAFGPAAQGLTTLDGFSTTAMLLAPTSGTIDAATVHAGSVFLYRLDGQNAPARLLELVEAAQEIGAGRAATASFVAEPPPITAACPITSGSCSTVIGLQPAVGVPLAGTPLAGICPALAPGGCALYAPPLQQKTSYAVVITNRVRDAAGAPLGRSTVTRILLEVTGALYDGARPAGQRSLLAGVDDATAQALQTMRTELAPVLAALPAGTTAAQVAAAYTFRTQTVTDGAAGILAAFTDAATTPAGAATFFTKEQVGADYGIDPAVAFPTIPNTTLQPIQEFAEVTFVTPNLLLSGNTQGALDPAHPTLESVTALVALPNPALVAGACPAGFTASRCAPLVVFRHGFPRAKADVLPLVTALTSRGFAVAAIDADKHGDRTYCTADNQCVPGNACVADPNLRTATDTTIVGRCQNGALLRSRLDCGTFDPATCISPKGIPLASGNLYVSANLFRTRDSARQDVIDQAVLINTLAPAQPRASGADQLAARMLSYAPTIAIHPDQIYFASLSLGSMNSALSVALNPRIQKGAFHAGGATLVDVFANPAAQDHPTLVALLGSFNPPILENTPEYLQFLQVAKWILDPADPANYGALIAASGKPVLSQIGLCDQRVPNDQNRLFTALLGLPVPEPTAGGTGFTQWFINAATGATCPDALADHGFLIDPWPPPPAAPTLTFQAQSSFGAFLATSAAQPATVRP
ncbi:MAG: hypothetical protein HZB56_11985 [Deltaproteobacteria bacterium]|nr:hypothetical protein [Deltaproteobacteria bacterium]